MIICWFAIEVLAKYGSVFPKLQIVPSDDHAKISCLSEAIPQWFHNGISLKQQINIHLFHNELHFNQTISEQTGNYTCMGTMENGTHFTDTSELLVGGKNNHDMHYNVLAR